MGGRGTASRAQGGGAATESRGPAEVGVVAEVVEAAEKRARQAWELTWPAEAVEEPERRRLWRRLRYSLWNVSLDQGWWRIGGVPSGLPQDFNEWVNSLIGDVDLRQRCLGLEFGEALEQMESAVRGALVRLKEIDEAVGSKRERSSFNRSWTLLCKELDEVERLRVLERVVMREEAER